MKILVILSVFCIISVHVESSLSIDFEGGQVDIISGDCNDPDPRKIVYRDHIEKIGIPLSKRDATVEWHGDQKIFCVTAISAKSEEKGSTAEITEGGVDHSFVTIKMESGRGHGLEYNILIYAE